MDTAVRERGNDTEVGISPLFAEPIPNCPPPLSPQQDTDPSSNTAQVCFEPAAIEIAVRPFGRLTEAGTLCGIFVPSPNWPRLFFPQHESELSFRIAQVWVSPVAKFIAVIPIGKSTLTGLLLSEVVPSPNLPLSF